MQAAIEATVVDESVGRYCVALAAATRTHGDVLMGASPRGSLGLLLCARAYAVIDGRDYVTPEDVKAVARAGPGAPHHRQARAVDEQRVRAQHRREPAAHRRDPVGARAPRRRHRPAGA